MAGKIRDGDPFPRMNVNTVAQGAMTLPDDLCGEWAMLLFYRGWW
jgi:alkyl hydroperoxide reductase subunit AhpC